MALTDDDITTLGSTGPEGPADSGAGQGTPGQSDGRADGSAEGPVDSGACDGCPGQQDGGADGGADSGAN